VNKHYTFKQSETENIINRFGRAFYEKVMADMDAYAGKWALTSFQLVPSYSANLVFLCESERFGSAVLKLSNLSHDEILTELNTLREYDGRRFCKVFDADMENGVILEECVRPGIPLRDESSLDKRLSVFCSLYKGLHIAPAKSDMYPTYTQWVGRITEYMSKREDCKPLYAHMKKANDICLSVAAQYSQTMLLHGDLHHDNILLGADGRYVIIDPKGVIGDPVFDIPRFVLNEFEDDKNADLYNKINGIIGTLEKNLHIPNEIIRQCLYVETAMGTCWCVDDGSTLEEHPDLMPTVDFAESILNT